MPRLPLAALTAALCWAGATSAWASTNGFYRQPALQGDQIYFVAEGDLWRVGTPGGHALRLTTHPGQESQPAVSPDGKWLAFTGQYDGGTEIYLMPTAGGPPRRLTWEGGGMRVWGFSAAGEVIYTSLDARPGAQLFALDVKTGQRRQLPVGQASDGALSADGRTLYFTRSGLRGDNARQYRGGAMSRLWSLDLSGSAEAKPLLPEGNNDKRPMPYGAAGQQRIAFLSDRDGTVNVWSVDARGGDLRQHTRHRGWDIRHASLDGSRMVYALGADLYAADLAQTGAPQKLGIALGGDFDQTRERWVKKPQDFLTDTSFAPNGERVLLAARGHLATQGVQQLRRAELPQPADGRCVKGEFSSDSKSVFATCDFSGETEIWRFAANGTGKPEQLTRGAATQRRDLLPSPDGRWLAHTDKEGHVWLTDLKTQSTREIARGTFNDTPLLQGFSADGKVLAWTVSLRHGDRNQLQLHQIAENRTHTLTSDRFDVSGASFSPDGQWLYFASARNFVTTGNPSPWGDRNTGPFFGFRTKLYALALQPDLRSPFAAKDELESATEKKADEQRAEDRKATDKNPTERKPDAKDDKKPEDKKDEKKGKPAIVFDGLAERLYELPVPAGNYRALRADGKRLWFLDRDLDNKSQLKSIAIDNQGGPAEILAQDVRAYELSADGKKLMLVRNQGQGAPEVLIVEAAPKLPTDLAKLQVRWSDWQIATQPRAEWKQMFADAWRLHRDHFYDKDMHGVDWAAMRAKYEPLVDRITDRFELAELMAQMVSELGALHSQVGPGDTRDAGEVPGLAGLGGRFSKGPDGWRIDAIYAHDAELPSDAPPLAAAGLGLKVGDVITAINGRPTVDAPHMLELLRGQAGRQVLLDVKLAAGGKTVQRIVTPVAQLRENQLRYNDWRVSRARVVEKAGQGRIGYVHLRAMGAADIADFVREYYAAGDRDGLIIDVRYNNGGNIDSWVLEKLLRRAWAFWQPRSPAGAAVYPNMQNVYRGHTVVLMNEDTYSDGETLAEGFKRLKLGPVIGRQSSGAGVWLSDGNRLIDNGIMRAAEFGQMGADGRFLIEGIGVKPDVDVDNLPRATFMGQDAQLEAAIAALKKKIAEEPVPVVKPGAYPRPVKP
ncbi:S41 family peptidase [Roseateles asaccharophilus]|uniref:Tricorn protease homolog n=1 Tax=Roseateles asaccharophilus TaxID=582607 RepID=A0ABU2A1H8_9BURK|nr:S41 family peptidase [Roseateles asaccharophilus]MDR7331029.1 tricorn protease [Roseateles asaccharophilus]